MGIIDHIGIAVKDYEKSKMFCEIAGLSIHLIVEVEGWAGFGRGEKPEFWFGVHDKAQLPMHFSFLADNRQQVEAFYKAALAAGGENNGAPGIRQIYHPYYYGAFVIDLNGHNIEAVCHQSA